MALKKLNLEAFGGNAQEPANEDAPAALTRTTVRLCFVTRQQASRISVLEAKLIKAWAQLSSGRGTACCLLLPKNRYASVAENLE
jgi:hypothetical protein